MSCASFIYFKLLKLTLKKALSTATWIPNLAFLAKNMINVSGMAHTQKTQFATFDINFEYVHEGAMVFTLTLNMFLLTGHLSKLTELSPSNWQSWTKLLKHQKIRRKRATPWIVLLITLLHFDYVMSAPFWFLITPSKFSFSRVTISSFCRWASSSSVSSFSSKE